MKKPLLPIGLANPDPRHSRFPLPNAVWGYRLKPIEFMILSYLCLCRAHGRTDKKTSADAVVKSVHSSAATVKKYLDALLDKGLITDQWLLNPSFLHNSGKNFFTLPNEIFLLNLPPSAFVVYAYLLLIEDRKTHTCHPSYNTIAAATGLSRNMVINSTTVLSDKKLIAVEHSSYFDKRGMKWNGNNLYTILPTRTAMDQFYQQQLCQLELESERSRARQRQAKSAHASFPNTAPGHESPRFAL